MRCFSQVLHHGLTIYAGFGAQIHRSVFSGIEVIIRLVLRVMHPEMLLNVFSQWMHLEGKIPSFDRIEKIETNRELISKACMHLLAKQQVQWLLAQDILRESKAPVSEQVELMPACVKVNAVFGKRVSSIAHTLGRYPSISVIEPPIKATCPRWLRSN